MTGQECVKIAAYADDISLFVRDCSSFCVFQQVFHEYGGVSGAQLNNKKTKALTFGYPTEVLPPDIQILDAVKVLGITLENKGISNRTWTEACTKAEKACQEAKNYMAYQ